MKNLFFILAWCLSLGTITGCGGSAPEGANILISTDKGDIYVKLFDDTPIHAANFRKLAKSGFFDGVSWHRVIPGFMIQTGDPNSKAGGSGAPGDAGYTLPAEIKPNHYHLRGALSAARQGDQVNPKWESSGSQFYIVQGKKSTDEELNAMQEGINSQVLQPRCQQDFYAKPENQWMRTFDKAEAMAANPDSANKVIQQMDAAWKAHLQNYNMINYPADIREKYKTVGGSPTLDYMYTVFGEVVQGMDVVDQIAAVKTSGPPLDKPLEDVRIISVKVLDEIPGK